MITTKFNYQPYKGTPNGLPSMAIPDQTMTLREILERHSRGLPISGNASTPIWEGEDSDGIDLKTLDLTERMEYLAERRKMLNQKMKEAKELFAKAQQDKQKEKELWEQFKAEREKSEEKNNSKSAEARNERINDESNK